MICFESGFSQEHPHIHVKQKGTGTFMCHTLNKQPQQALLEAAIQNIQQQDIVIDREKINESAIDFPTITEIVYDAIDKNDAAERNIYLPDIEEFDYRLKNDRKSILNHALQLEPSLIDPIVDVIGRDLAKNQTFTQKEFFGPFWTDEDAYQLEQQLILYYETQAEFLDGLANNILDILIDRKYRTKQYVDIKNYMDAQDIQFYYYFEEFE